MPPAREGNAAKDRVVDALAKARRRAGGGARPAGTRPAVMALQRAAGNSAVSALIAAKLRAPGASELDPALRELRRDEPAIDTVEKGLKRAKELGVPVFLEGPKPPASALAVTTTGFGPGQVPPKKPVPPPEPVPAKSPLGTSAAKAPAKPSGKGGAGGTGPVKGPATGPAPATGTAPATGALGPALSGTQLLQPPVPPSGTRPEEDPAFAGVVRGVGGFAKAKRAHADPRTKAAEAQGAALPPTDDIAGQAKAAKADTMDAQRPGSFDKKAFIAAVKTAIEAKSPKNLKEAASYKESGKAGEVKGEVAGMVTEGKQAQSRDIEQATDAPPDTSKAVPKPVTPMQPESPGASATIPATGAVPKPAPPEQTNLQAGKHQADAELAEGGVSEDQLKESNEPEFTQALDDKKAAAQHADTAPGEFRKHEAEVIDQQKAEAKAETASGVAGMQASKMTAIAQLVAGKGKAKTQDETRRAQVTAKIQGIFNATETAVKKILDAIDPKVEQAFDTGEKVARSLFENYVSAKMSAYKKDRYSGWLGGLRWAKDKLLGMPDKVNEFYVAGRELYLKEMDKVISRVADIVGNDLTAAKQRIASGRQEIASYVKSLPADLKKVGANASAEISERFEKLESDVDAKQDAMVETLASKYTEARKGLDDRIEELQAENRGLVDKAIGAIKAVIETIRKLAAMLRDVLSRVAGVVGSIIQAPVKFLGNLISGIKGGILRFKDNIVEHLRNGLMSWLFGALASGGVELPESFDVKGIITFLLSLFGLTWRSIRNRLVKQIGEPAMAAMEKGVDIFQKLVAGGVGALWEMLLEKLGDIKEMILEQVKDFVVTKIITAGITWLIGLLNPAAAFIKACKLIYDVVMFFVDNAARIAKFVNTVLDSMADIVRGNIGGVVAKIEDALSQMLPILIGFLASVIGLGGIGEKVRAIVQTLQKPVNKALDFVIKTGLKLAGPVIRGLKRIGSKVKAKVASGKAWVKGKVEKGKQWVKGKASAAVRGIRDWFTLRKRFTAADGAHTLYWTGRGGRLTMASAPTPVDAVLVTARRMIGPGHPNHGDLGRAAAQQAQVLAIKATVEQSGPGGRQPADVDRLNLAMEQLAALLVPLVPVVFPATAPAAPGTLPAWVQPFALVKLKRRNVVARVLAVDHSNPALPMVQYQILRERSKPDDTFHAPTKGPTGGPEKVSANGVNLDWVQYQDDPRNYYMGPNPSINGPVGRAVQARMRAEGRLVGDKVRYGRDAAGNPLPPGQVTMWALDDCEMGHVIDAVTWWNSNGRFTGPQSPEVRQFMTDPDNYEIEPSGPNQARGRALGRRQQYLPSTR